MNTTPQQDPVRILYSFPHKLGATRICNTAWQQVTGLADAGAQVLAYPGVLSKPVQSTVIVQPTLARGKFRIPYKLLGRMRACALHDYIVAHRLERLSGLIDIVHTWPLGAIRTLRTAAKLGICSVLERPNTHTRFGYTVVNNECKRIGITLPPTDEHAFNSAILAKEEEEYRCADYILCPSDFVMRTFLNQGIQREKLIRHSYGFDNQMFYASTSPPDPARPLTALFVGACTVVKGLHFALDAWMQSSAHQNGIFQIAGSFLPAYRNLLSHYLAYPSIKFLGQRTDIPELMRQSDILILPSLTEGFPLVMAEAMGSGCIPLVSDVCPEICAHDENCLIHHVGDVPTLAQQLSWISENVDLRTKLRAGCLRTAPRLTWARAGHTLLNAYRGILNRSARPPETPPMAI